MTSNLINETDFDRIFRLDNAATAARDACCATGDCSCKRLVSAVGQECECTPTDCDTPKRIREEGGA